MMIFLTIAGVVLGGIGVIFAIAFYLRMESAEFEIDRLYDAVDRMGEACDELDREFAKYQREVRNRIGVTTSGNRIDRFM